MKRPSTSSWLAGLVLTLASLGPLSGCATTTSNSKTGQSDQRSEKLNAAKKKKPAGLKPGSYSIYRQNQIDKRILRRGKQANYAPALDSY